MSLVLVLLLSVLIFTAEGANTTTASITTSTTPLPGSLTCRDVAAVGSAANVPSVRLKALQPEEVVSCIALLGKDPLAEDQARVLWDAIVQLYGMADLIPDEKLRLLGWVAAGIPTEHFANLTLSDIDTVAALGVYHNLNQEQLTALAEAVRFQWSSKEPEDFSYLDLSALGHILCGMNGSDIARVHADAYKEAAPSLSTLHGCPPDALRALAGLAADGDAFGDPTYWTSAQVRSVGCVLAGLPNSTLVKISAQATEGMSSSVQQCLPGSVRQLLSSSSDQTGSSADAGAGGAGGQRVSQTRTHQVQQAGVHQVDSAPGVVQQQEQAQAAGQARRTQRGQAGAHAARVVAGTLSHIAGFLAVVFYHIVV